MTARIRLSRRARIRIYDRAKGVCHLCGLPIRAERGERWEVEHIKPRWLGGTDHESNLAPAHRWPCHEQKNAEENPVRSKTDRQRANYLGINKSGAKLPCGKDSNWSKPIYGPPIPRVKERGAKDRTVMAKRQIGGGS